MEFHSANTVQEHATPIIHTDIFNESCVLCYLDQLVIFIHMKVLRFKFSVSCTALSFYEDCPTIVRLYWNYLPDKTGWTFLQFHFSKQEFRHILSRNVSPLCITATPLDQNTLILVTCSGGSICFCRAVYSYFTTLTRRIVKLHSAIELLLSASIARMPLSGHLQNYAHSQNL